VARLLLRLIAAALVLGALVVLGFILNVAIGMRAHARETGAISGLRLRGPVSILRDDRDVPHIVAGNDHDLFFAQGYAEGSDRLFQMDLLRRFVLGELAEVFGQTALRHDEIAREVPVRAIAQAQWQRLDLPSRELLGAFSEGVNAAMARETLPVEFRLLAYRPRPWTPQDSLAVSMATVLDLTDDWNSIEPRDVAYRRGGAALFNQLFPLTDLCYDAPVMAGLSHPAPGARCQRHVAALVSGLSDSRAPVGSNEWAAGANRSLHGRALLANDPHLALHMPGAWYLIDLRSPGLHVAGATLPGCPGVVLGHNENLAWGATNGTVTSLSAFLAPAHLDPAGWQNEWFAVRFRSSVRQRYYRARGVFGVATVATGDHRFILVKWNAYNNPVSPALTFVALDRATSIEAATAALAKFPGPTQNFVLADTSGRAAYVLAGSIPNDPVRARWFHPANDFAKSYPPIPFARLPKVAPSRDAVVWTANNKMYGREYPLQLSPQFATPYRAYRIAQLLRARRAYDIEYFTKMQLDVLSLPERELARDVSKALGDRDPLLASQLAAWDGEMDGASTTATVVEGMRVALTQRHNGRMPTVLAMMETAKARTDGLTLPSPAPWRFAGAETVPHALASLGIDFLDGITLPGNGDAFTLHMQSPGYSQSFRAVWEIGNWDAGGITLPQGESGEPGSGYYTDQATAWIAGRLWPLPFSDAAVARTAANRQTLSP
jgi:penicillin amidase